MAPLILQSAEVSCPYCGEPIEMLVDGSVAEQDYVEDCQVCCRPIVARVSVARDGTFTLQVAREDEA